MPTSRRGYLTIAELQEYANITVSDDTEALDQISQAEELIDAYVGYQEKHVPRTVQGEVQSAAGRVVVDNGAGNRLQRIDNYYALCEIRIFGGTGSGQVKKIVSSSKIDCSVTVDSDWDVLPDTTSMFEISQVGKFPRCKDAWTNRNASKWFSNIPEAVRRATAAQVQFFLEMGEDYFSGGDSDKNSEHIGNYSYSRGSGAEGQTSLIKLIAPKARNLLRGITNRTGQIVRD